MDNQLSKKDYEEPRCLLNMHPDVHPIPVGRVIGKLDSYLDREDYQSAGRHLKYWLTEAEAFHDDRGRLTVLNEQIGLYRKIGEETECLEAISAALSLAEKMEIGDSISFGTTLVNAATGYKAFGKAEQSLPLYRRAREIYEKNLSPDDGRLGGLYNNMALVLTGLGAYREAEDLFFKAIGVMEQQENGEPETAITYLNLADLTAAEKGTEDGEEQIGEYLRKAEELLNTESIPQNGYYAYVCEKCAPVFGYYGYFLTESELIERGRKIRERT